MLTGWLTSGVAVRIAAALGLIGVGLGAFGAHGLHDLLAAQDRLETWKTAVLYQLVHAVAMLAVAFRVPLARGTFVLFLLGVLIFSGSLYLLSLTGARWLGAVTPLGGLAFLAGWAWLIARG